MLEDGSLEDVLVLEDALGLEDVLVLEESLEHRLGQPLERHSEQALALEVLEVLEVLEEVLDVVDVLEILEQPLEVVEVLEVLLSGPCHCTWLLCDLWRMPCDSLLVLWSCWSHSSTALPMPACLAPLSVVAGLESKALYVQPRRLR